MIFSKLVFNPADGQCQHFGETLKVSSLLQRDTPSSIQGIQNCYENYGYATYPDSRVRLALFLHSRSTPGPFGWINFLFYGCSESPGCYWEQCTYKTSENMLTNLNNDRITLNKVKLSFCGIFQSAVFANRIVNISLWALESEDLAALLQQNCSLDSFRLFKRRSETAGKLKRNVWKQVENWENWEGQCICLKMRIGKNAITNKTWAI